MRSAFTLANKTGDPLAAAASGAMLVWYVLVAGEPLVEAQKEAEADLEFCRKLGFAGLLDHGVMRASYIRNLRGLTPHFGSLDDDRFEERRLESFFATQPHLRMLECEYWIRKLQVRFMAGDYVAAMDASIRASGLLWAASVLILRAEYDFYSALTRAVACDSQPASERPAHLGALAAHGRRLDACARACPENFDDRAALVAAEIARLEGRDPEAMHLYEQAIRSARDNEFIHNEALALEVAGRFYAARGLNRIASTYIRDARNAFRQWGAEGKVRQLEAQCPYLTEERSSSDPKQTMLASVEQLDLSAVLKVSQAVQGETDLEKLIATVMRLAVEHAGAERGLLILPHADSHRIEAEARSSHERVTVDLRQATIGTGDVPSSVLQYVLRTREQVLIQDASTSKEFADDEYLRRHHARSMVCIPLIKQARLIGIIYLENRLTSGAFTAARMSLLEVLASDAAISLENARLYRDLQEREADLHEAQRLSRTGSWKLDLASGAVRVSPEVLRIFAFNPMRIRRVRTSGSTGFTTKTAVALVSTSNDA
jgi:hypothetical protein